MMEWKKILLISVFLLTIFFGIYFINKAVSTNTREIESNPDNSISSEEISLNEIQTNLDKEPTYDGFFKNRPISILLLGLDIGSERKARGQRGSNADTIMVLSIHPENKRAVFTSIPRDLWVGRSKINAVLNISGVEEMEKRASEIVGHPIDTYASIDFDGLRWLIDYFGGVEIEVENSFTDNSFPNNQDTAVTTVSFNEGSEVMTGERALTFARSRKGNNGEGSDLKRAKRQHLILKGLLGAISSPRSGKEFDITTFYNDVILNTKTTITLNDALYLFSFYKDYKDYQIESLVLDDRYIYHPTDSTPYGGAWVFVSKDPNFESLKKDLNLLLSKDASLPDKQN